MLSILVRLIARVCSATSLASLTVVCVADAGLLAQTTTQDDSKSLTVPAPAESSANTNRDSSTNSVGGKDSSKEKDKEQESKQPKSTRYNFLAQPIERAKASLSKANLPDRDAAKARLVEEIQRFSKYLGSAESRIAQGWYTYLDWDILLKELLKKEPDLRTMTDIKMNFCQNVRGLEYQPYYDMRRALSDYIDAERFSKDPETTLKFLNGQLDKLGEIADGASAPSDLEAARDFSLVVSNLKASNQASELVSLMRSIYSQPNVRVIASESFVNRRLARPVSQPNPVDECVLGTRVIGNSYISGNVFADLVPQHNGISMRLCMNANFSSNNIGYNRGVKVYTTGSAPISASKLITVTPTGTFTQPAVASAQLNTQINGIEHRLRIVRRIASRKAAEQKPEANAIGEHRLQTRLATQFNKQVEDQLRSNNTNLGILNREFVELQRIGITKPTTSIYSTDTSVHVDALQAEPNQFAAPSGPFSSPMSDAVAQVHQSLAINLASAFLSGRTLKNSDLDNFYTQFTGKEPPEELKKESEGEAWSLSFADHQPVEVEFTNGELHVHLRISKMTRGDQELSQPATVTAIYRSQIADGQIKFVRQGDVELSFVRAPSGFRAVALRSFLKGKFDRFFREESEYRSLTFGGRTPNIPQLTVQQVAFENGWATLTIR